MRKILLFNIAGLLLAGAVCMSAAAYTATKLETVSAAPPNSFDDNFIQEEAPGIADLLSDSGWLDQFSSQPEAGSGAEDGAGTESSGPVSSEAVPSEPPASSRPPASSAPASSEPVSGEAPSSEPPVSSEAPSSEPESSEPPPSSEEEPVDPIVPEGDYAELLDALAGAVQREIVGVGTPPQPQYYEAYKAQAVASHSYMEYHRQRSGSYPAMSYTTPDPRTTAVVAEVLNELIYYNGAVINASYHAASGGHTQSAAAVWGSDIPYLVGVESAYDDSVRTFSISEADAADKLSAAGIPVDGDPAGWFDLAGATLTDGSFVDHISICGVNVRGRTLRESIFGPANLMSCKIADITWDGSELHFTTLGYGHGAGMSQLGALGYAANEGWSYRDILTHYYTGVVIQ